MSIFTESILRTIGGKDDGYSENNRISKKDKEVYIES